MKLITTTEFNPWRTSILNIENSKDHASTLKTTGESLQSIDGFGGCFNELGWIALQKVSPTQQEEILNALFSSKGCNFSQCRLPIGASDYAEKWYSHNETENDYAMDCFSIERDYSHLIPYIKAAQNINPNLSFFASPWSPPTWMKTPPVCNYGTLNQDKKTLTAYALYFLNYIKAYEKEHIPISQLHVQNEPMSSQKFPSCVWTGEEMTHFISDYLGPLFESENIDTKIWLGTLNGRETDHRALHTGYDDYANLALSNEIAYKYIEGVSYQWAGKNSIQRTHDSWPEKKLMQSENECGDGNNTWAYARYVFDLFRHYLSNGANSYIYWNMVLEPQGSSSWGWHQNSMITINPDSQTFTYNHEFYVMKHFSHFIKPGAVRLKTTGHLTGNSIVFKNPNGDLVIVLQNGLNHEKLLSFSHENISLQLYLQPNSINTILLEKEEWSV